jgi:hypothetical protein
MRKPLLPAVLALLAALGPAPLLAQATTKPSLTVVLPLTGCRSRPDTTGPGIVPQAPARGGQVETGRATATSPRRALPRRSRRFRRGSRASGQPLIERSDGFGAGRSAQPWATDVVSGQPPLYREVDRTGGSIPRPRGELTSGRGPGRRGASSACGRAGGETVAEQRGCDHAQPVARPAEGDRSTTTPPPGNLR